MNRKNCTAALLATATCLVGCMGPGSGDGQTSSGSEAAVREVLAANAEFYDALNVMFTGDVTRMEGMWSHADDVTYLPPTGERLRGWEAVRASWRSQADMRLGGRVTARDVEALVINPSTAVVTVTEVGSNPNSPGGPIDVNIRSTKVFRLESGGWKLIYDHADVLPGLAGPGR